jgi:hypothetical protein
MVSIVIAIIIIIIIIIIIYNFMKLHNFGDRLCGLVVRVSGY